jgi:uncharacterized protein (DUF1778 family)
MKTARLEARLTEDQKELVARAAGYQGVSQTDFVLMAVLDEARRVVREQGVVELSLEQSRRVAEAMISPPEPNPALRKAFAEHRAKVTS